MKQYIQIATTDNIVRLGMMQTLLRVNDIDFVTRDEYYLQVDPLATYAVGGAKLLVEESQATNALEILEKSGHQIKESEERLPPFMEEITKYTNKIPFLKNLNEELKLIAGLSIFFVALAIVAYCLLMLIYF